MPTLRTPTVQHPGAAVSLPPSHPAEECWEAARRQQPPAACACPVCARPLISPHSAVTAAAWLLAPSSRTLTCRMHSCRARAGLQRGSALRKRRRAADCSPGQRGALDACCAQQAPQRAALQRRAELLRDRHRQRDCAIVLACTRRTLDSGKGPGSASPTSEASVCATKGWQCRLPSVSHAVQATRDTPEAQAAPLGAGAERRWPLSGWLLLAGAASSGSPQRRVRTERHHVAQVLVLEGQQGPPVDARPHIPGHVVSLLEGHLCSSSHSQGTQLQTACLCSVVTQSASWKATCAPAEAVRVRGAHLQTA